MLCCAVLALVVVVELTVAVLSLVVAVAAEVVMVVVVDLGGAEMGVAAGGCACGSGMLCLR